MSTENGIEPEPETDALRSGLLTRAGLITIAPPPIPAVRRNAKKRRTRRRTVQGLSSLAATCGVVASVIAWSPGQDVGIGPAPADEDTPTATRTMAPPSPLPTHTTRSTTAPPAQTTSASDYLRASDLGAGWTGPDSDLAPRPALSVGTTQCEIAGDYRAQVPVTPAPNKDYSFPASGGQTNKLFEAVYTFAPDTGPTVMANVRAALKTGCGLPKYIRLLDTPSTVADEAIVFTVGGGRNVLVRSGDRVASVVVDPIPAGPAGIAWITDVARQMAIRLTGG
jgi:hypothetical protein